MQAAADIQEADFGECGSNSVGVVVEFEDILPAAPACSTSEPSSEPVETAEKGMCWHFKL